jgi:hypothetical protein
MDREISSASVRAVSADGDPPPRRLRRALKLSVPLGFFLELLSPLGVFILHRSHFLGPDGESASPGFFHDTPTHRGERAGVEFVNGKKPGGEAWSHMHGRWLRNTAISESVARYRCACGNLGRGASFLRSQPKKSVIAHGDYHLPVCN